MRTCFILLFWITGVAAWAQKPLLFAYFVENGQDGLHLAASKDGLQWRALHQGNPLLSPELGDEKLMRDPCIIQGQDGTFHLVWTIGWNARGIGYAHSKDLIHWSAQRYVPVMEHEPEARNCWAPEVLYAKKEKQYYIYWSTTINGAFPETDSTAESNYNHRIYYTTTRDFINFAPTKLLYDGGYNVIDATAVRAGKEYVFIVKNETRFPQAEKNLRSIRAASLTGPYSAPSAPVTGAYWAEGPTVSRLNGWWMLYFDKYLEHQMGALRSRDLRKWEDISAMVSFPKGMRHGTVFKVSASRLRQLEQAPIPH